MASKIVISDFSSGLQNNVPAFKVNNDAFPKLRNFFVWRSRVLRKRGTAFLGRLQRDLTAVSLNTITLAGASPNNVTFGSLFTPSQTNASVIPGNLSNISLVIGAQTLTDTTGTGTFSIAPAGNITAATIAYATGVITITFAAPAGPLAVTFTGSYFPNLPVMGCEDFIPNNALTSTIPINNAEPLCFDTTYSYEYDFNSFDPSDPTDFVDRFHDVSFYKITGLPLVWSGADYQQFWSCNYYNATWVTNGKPGFHFKVTTNIIRTGQADPDGTAPTPIPAGLTRLFITAHGLIVGDRVWLNEVVGMTEINGLTLTVASVVNANKVDVTLDSTAFSAYSSGGIAQYLTSSISGQDGIRWYDGDPTSSSTVGWVNFAPPLSNVANPDYLVGAIALVPFKDRLLAFGPSIRTSASSTITYLNDSVIFSQNGTPFYTSLVPLRVEAPSNSSAWYNNVAGFGGDVSAGINQSILTVGNNEDVLIVGFPNRQTRLVYTGNDFLPFLFYSINSERGADATFASVSLDKIVYNVGPYGFTSTTQTNVERVDLQIPDDVFAIKSADNGIQRICGVRDFRNEYIFFTVPSPENGYKFPTKTYLYNYLNNTWANLDENFTSYGQFWDRNDYTWSNNKYEDGWSTEATWISSSNVSRYPSVMGGNQQGFILIKEEKDVGEAQSQYVSAFTYATIAGSNPVQQLITVTSPNHCLSNDDFVRFDNLSGISNVSSNNYKVTNISGDTFTAIHPPTTTEVTAQLSGTYNGIGTYARFVRPELQTKQFQPFWEQGKRTRLGTSRFLFDRTQEGEVTAQIFVSQESSSPINTPPDFPDPSDSNNALIFSDIVFTSPETGNLNTPLAPSQSQIWHRMSTSAVGDSVQIGITLSDDQMIDEVLSDEEVSLHQITLDVYPSGILI